MSTDVIEREARTDRPRRRKRLTRVGFLFAAPFLLLMLFLWGVPIVSGFWTSLTDTNMAEGTGGFVGLDNYAHLATDPDFRAALGNTALFVVLNVPILVAVGLLLAMLLNQPLGGRGAIRAAFISPYLLTGAAVAIIWQTALNPLGGNLNQVLSAVGLPEQAWLSTPGQAMGGVVLITLWWRVGFPLLVLLAALQDIPAQLYEAAKIDGANVWQRFRYVTLPAIAPVLMLVVLLRLIDSFKVFEQVYLVTQGGPAGSTRVVLQMLYESGFRDFQTGYASAIGWTLAFIILVVTVLQLALTRRRESR
ncbi:carbohydrate ABC transporter permease [Glycomyces harbinensis]|uniref:Multiple sugar transport system permease protein/raffinose/stachyose/melibiose transport system permease protein n=1 Tax=Glycomyces harbinensis TaxID=58114 RepID=A0A1G6QWZ6_9ACTN|nr:sugar ABC transporter permease [Glycomyces harbinensis]SDC96514.1 multiple sugar transport system permease protein/raffinose/stachyose/melibiose transport system permease protein [Glycomyces harbinensis]